MPWRSGRLVEIELDVHVVADVEAGREAERELSVHVAHRGNRADTDRLGLGAMVAERWKETADQMVDLGKIKAAPAAESLFRWTSPVK